MEDISALHFAEYGEAPEFTCKAPGILRLLGEQTRTLAGASLLMPVSFSLSVAVSRRKDNQYRFFSADLNERKRATFPHLKYKREDRWANFLKVPLGAVAQSAEGLSGASFTIKSDIPVQSGFSSSSALILATYLVCRELVQNRVPPGNELEILEDFEEECLSYDEIPCVASAISLQKKKKSAWLFDYSSNVLESCRFDLGKRKFVLTDSRVPRLPAQPELLVRQDLVRKAIDYCSQKNRNIRTIRDCSMDDLQVRIPGASEAVRRYMLFIMEEIIRCRDAEASLEAEDLPAFGKIITKSHEGLSDLYEVSCPEIDWLVKRACEIDGTAGSRLVGQGFGGCTVSIMDDMAIEEYRKRLEEYERIFGFKAVLQVFGQGDPAAILR